MACIVKSSIPVIDRKAKLAEKFSDVWKKAKTGDLFFVSGARDLDGVSAIATKIGSSSPFSHVGLIIRDPTEKMWAQYGRLRAPATVELGTGAWNKGEEVPRDRQVYLWDSDWEEDGTVDGPALRPLQEVMTEYLEDDYHGTDTDCIIRFLKVDDATRADIKAKIEDFSLEMAGKQYEAKTLDVAHIKDGSFPQLAKCLWGLSAKEDLDRLFCSELVAAAYRAAGLLGPEINATNYAPGHFDDDRMNDLLRGASLSPETRIDDEELMYRIRVTIKDIKDLADASWVDKVDPYVVMKFHGRFRFKTNVIKDNGNPVFNAANEQWYDGESNIEFEVWDKNRMRKDVMVASGFLPSACVLGVGGKEESDPVEERCTTFDGVLALTQEFVLEEAPMRLTIEVLSVPSEELVDPVMKAKMKAKRAKKKLIAAQAAKMFRMHGCMSPGGDLLPGPVKMTLKRAIQQAAIMPNCKGFCYRLPKKEGEEIFQLKLLKKGTTEAAEGEDILTMKTPLDIHFKSKCDNCQVPGWESMAFHEEKKTMSHEFADATSTAGQKLQYLSDKQNMWFDCTVLGGDGDGGIFVDIQGTKRQVSAFRCATNLRPIYEPCQMAKYYSEHQSTWFECVIKSVTLGQNADEGGIAIDISGHAVMVENMQVVTHLKPKTQGAPAFAVGQDVEVKRSSGEWVAATITEVKPNMNLVATMKGEAVSKEIPPEGVSSFLRHVPASGGGGGYPA